MRKVFGFLDRPRIKRADALRDQGRWAEAAEAYRAILRRRPGRAGVWLQLGHCLRQLGRPLEALSAYRQADRYRPDHADTLFQLAATLGETGAPAEVHGLYERIIALADAHPPNDTAGWLQLGHSLRRLSLLDEALAAYREADTRQPDDPEILFHLATTQRDLGHREEAERQFGRILETGTARADLLNAARVGSRHDDVRPQWLDHVMLGTTGTCNASCVHCPTGKLATARSPRHPMPMPLFRKIVDEIAESGLPVAGGVGFGLFGDGLADPHVVDRARYLRERLPEVVLNVNTNGAAYDPARHAKLNNYVSIIALHCESLVPETYDYLMQPLRAERVHAKYPMILRDFPGKVLVSVPVSQVNADERPAMLEYFYGLGAANVVFSSINNRLGFDDALFDRLAFGPGPVECGPQIMHNLIVDCDGMVLACCNDFSRIDPVGNLNVESLAETLASRRRLAFHDQLRRGCHGDMPTCGSCRADFAIPPIGQKSKPLLNPAVVHRL